MNLGADGRVLLYDHGGCDTAAVLDAAGLDWNDIAGNGGAAPEPAAAEVSWEIRDRNGRVVAVHHRRDLTDGRKRVWWTRGGNKGLDGLKVVDLPLYGTDRLVDGERGDDTPTFLLEGEPATDALRGLGLSAVGTVTGAASAPSAEPLEILRDRDVVAWADADGAGRAHMRKLAGMLDGVALRVRLLLEEGDDGSDAADWVTARERDDVGAIVAELRERIEHQAVDSETLADSEEADWVLNGKRSFDIDLTDDGLALELGDRWPDARHVAAWNQWLFFKESRWVVDKCLKHMTRGRDFLREKVEALEEWAEKKAESLDGEARKKFRRWVRNKPDKLRSAQTVRQVVGLARSNDAQAAQVAQWDRDPWLLGTPGGTVDLRTGEVRDARPEDYITKATAVVPAPQGTPTPPLWAAFLDRIMGHKEQVGYMQRFAGYALTGSIQEHAFVFGHGTGANGKGVFTGTLQGCSGRLRADRAHGDAHGHAERASPDGVGPVAWRPPGDRVGDRGRQDLGGGTHQVLDRW